MTKLTGTIQTKAQLEGKMNATQVLKGKINTGVSLVEQSHIYQFSSIYEFPNLGTKDSLYMINGEENASYRWDEETQRYYCVGRDYEEINNIIGGKANG